VSKSPGAEVADINESEAAPLRLSGWLLDSPHDGVRILLASDICLVVSLDSIERVVLADEPENQTKGALAATLHLRPRPVLLDIGPGAPWRAWARPYPRPFALAVRPTKPEMTGHREYLKREADYLAEHGLARMRDGGEDQNGHQQ
jgi:hypothetical protein